MAKCIVCAQQSYRRLCWRCEQIARDATPEDVVGWHVELHATEVKLADLRAERALLGNMVASAKTLLSSAAALATLRDSGSHPEGENAEGG